MKHVGAVKENPVPPGVSSKQQIGNKMTTETKMG